MKNKSNLLLGRSYEVEGTWYAPEKKLKEYESVVMSDYYDTTSSAGDWSGYFVQKIGKRFYLIIFSQENIGFTPYFKLFTDSIPLAKFDHKPTKDEVYSVIELMQGLW